MQKINITKYIAHSGFCSRRDAEKLIENGEVKINNKIINNAAIDICENDKVFINDQLIKQIKNIRLFAFHKPKGVIVSKIDDRGRQTIFDILDLKYKKFLKDERLVYIGRLDFNSEGLLLLTNFGPLARFFELPSNQIPRVYEVKIFGKWRDEISDILKKGVTIDKIKYGPIKTKIIRKSEKQTWIECELFEGKNNELRKIFKHFGFLVSHLKRTKYERFSLSNLAKTDLQEIPNQIVKKILEKINLDDV
jgi:23S rRNA pseudouridine2605 synthase